MNDQVNGIGEMPEELKEHIKMTNPAIQLAKQVLADAEAGKIVSLAIIGVMPASNIITAFAGVNRTEIYTGAGILQRRIEMELTAPQQKGSGILMPRR